MIIRKRGGAKVRKEEVDEPPLLIITFKRTNEKEKIGKLAVSLIQDHNVIWLDPGATTLQMIPYICAKDIFFWEQIVLNIFLL